MADPKIRIRRSATPNKVPNITQLELGELAINTYDGKLYLEQDQGASGVGNTVVRVNPWNVGLGTTAYNITFEAGKVGIGTTLARYNLDVGGNINFTGNLTQDGAAFTSGVTVKDEGSALSTQATILNFVGNGVAATGNGAEKTITITSGSGPAGPTGAQGAAGATGAQGASGAGAQGATGAQGAQGHQGATGAGAQGAQGATGSGSTGAQGATGSGGSTGAQGAQGAQGASGGGGGGGASVSVGSNPPGSPSGGDLWWDSDVGELFIYYADTDSNQWVETAGGSETVTVSDNAPPSPNAGDLWFESDTGQLKLYYQDADSAQWIDANAGVLSNLTVWQTNSTGINTSSNVGIGTTTADATLTVDGNVRITGISTFRDIDVDGHTNLDNVSIAGVTTFANNVFLGDNDRILFGDGGLSDAHVRYDGNNLQWGVASGQFRVSANTSSFVNYAGTQTLATINSTGVSIPLNLDVDGHTNLDNVSIAGVTTITGALDVINTSNTTIRLYDSTGTPDSFGSIGYNNGNDADDALVIAVDGDNQQSNSHMRFYVDGLTSSAEKFRVDSSGISVTGSTVVSGDLDVSEDIRHIGDTDTRLRFETDTISARTAGSERLRIHSSGQIQIGGTTLINSDPLLTLGQSASAVGAQFHLVNNGSADLKQIFISAGKASRHIGIDVSTNNFFMGRDGVDSDLVITSAGLVGINAASPREKLDVSSGRIILDQGYQFTWANGTTNRARIHGDSGSNFIIETGSSNVERLRITSGGNIQIGAGSVALPKATQGGVDIDSGAYTACIGGNVNSSGRTNSTDKLNRITSPHYTNAEEPVALVSSYNQSGNNFIQYGGGSSITNAATQHIFYTAANTTTTSGTERLRILSDGKIAFNSGGTVNATYQFDYAPATGGIIVNANASFTGNSIAIQFRTAPSTVSGSITLTNNGATTAYVPNSDYRLKENETALTDSIARLKLLKPLKFNWKSQPDKTVDGFFAHEVATVVPDAVMGEKDAVDSDNNPILQGLDSTRIIPLLTAALQEAITKIETLEAEVSALKSS